MSADNLALLRLELGVIWRFSRCSIALSDIEGTSKSLIGGHTNLYFLNPVKEGVAHQEKRYNKLRKISRNNCSLGRGYQY